MKRAEARTRPIAELLADEQVLRAPPASAHEASQKVLLVSPSPYPVAMGGLSLQAVWENLEATGQFRCDRAFSAWPDGPALEPAASLRAYGLVGFSLPYELDWLAVPAVLRAGGLEPWADRRADDDPVVMAGGAAVTMNPEPLTDVVDVFVIGEFEPLAPLFAQAIAALGPSDRPTRLEVIDLLAGLPGVYVPTRPGPTPVKRLAWTGLTDMPRRSLALSPHTTFADRYLVEVGRGCPGGCRFCLARSIYGPVRYAAREAVLRACDEALAVTGRIGLIGASLTGYPDLTDLVATLVAQGTDVSLSSLRADRIAPELLAALRRGGQETVTIAPEAGTEPLRRAVGKPIRDEELGQALAAAEKAGMSGVRLYFMAGLPGETEDDARAIASQVETWSAAFPRLRFAVTLSPFVPKPWTSFETEVFAGVDAMRTRLETVARELRTRTRARVRVGSARWAAVQAALARGGREIGRALVSAADEGGGFSAMKRALKAMGVDVAGPMAGSKGAPWRQAVDAGAVCEME